MSKRIERFDEYQEHIKRSWQLGGEAFAYAGMAVFAIGGLALSLFDRKKEDKIVDKIWNSELENHVWLDVDEETEEE